MASLLHTLWAVPAAHRALGLLGALQHAAPVRFTGDLSAFGTSRPLAGEARELVAVLVVASLRRARDLWH